MKLLRQASYVAAFGCGVVLAALSAKLLFHGSVLNIVPWGITSLILGFVALSPKHAWRLGAVFGFTVSYCFLWFDKTDHTSLHQFFMLLIIIPLPSLFGALCGSVLARLGYAVKRK